MESNLVLELMKAAGCDIETAYICLLSENWSLQSALELWKQQSSGGAEPRAAEPAGKLQRGISRVSGNVSLVEEQRTLCGADGFGECSFALPDLSDYDDAFKKYLEKDLIEASTLASLEQSGRLNWWCQGCWAAASLGERLWPLATSGDGNCLLHAASLATWGFHDRLLTLRRALYAFLKESDCRQALYRRWRWQQTHINERSGFVYSEVEWAREWDSIVGMASVEPRSGHAAVYESLEEIHVLALAHVLRRAVVVLADVVLRDINDQPLAPISFGGIYLPLECEPEACHRAPLFLAYDTAHFSALVLMERAADDEHQLPAVVPLTDSEGALLPLQFAVDPGPDFVWAEKHDQAVLNCLVATERDQLELLQRYLDLIHLCDPADGDDDQPQQPHHRNKAAKQLQVVAKQFGSIGKSMGRRIRKNLDILSKLAKQQPAKQLSSAASSSSSSPSPSPGQVVCVEVQRRKHPHHDEMVRNYIAFARARHLQEKQLQEQQTCDRYDGNPRFGAGRSMFYRPSDLESYKAILKLPEAKHANARDRTLYLSKSTFYNDSGSTLDEDTSDNFQKPKDCLDVPK